MSEFAFFRFMSSNMLTLEEQQHKDEIVSLTDIDFLRNYIILLTLRFNLTIFAIAKYESQ
jgi:hypothetical protein